MKIGIPVNKESMDAGVADSFGRAEYFLIYDTESKESKYIENSAATSQGGAGIKAAQIVVDSKVEALIAPRCGKNAAEVLKEADIKLYKTINNSIEENIKAFNNDQSPLLENIHEGFHNGGGK